MSSVIVYVGEHAPNPSATARPHAAMFVMTCQFLHRMCPASSRAETRKTAALLHRPHPDLFHLHQPDPPFPSGSRRACPPRPWPSPPPTTPARSMAWTGLTSRPPRPIVGFVL
jgi:hypothetical protein